MKKKEKTEHNKIDADHSNQLLRPYREKQKTKTKEAWRVQVSDDRK